MKDVLILVVLTIKCGSQRENVGGQVVTIALYSEEKRGTRFLASSQIVYFAPMLDQELCTFDLHIFELLQGFGVLLSILRLLAICE